MNETVQQKGRNRGKSSEDNNLFSPPKEQARIREALCDMYYLLSRRYPIKPALALVGNRHRLRARQLLALQGMACSAHEIEERAGRQLTPDDLQGSVLYIDGFNLLILLETLLSGGYIFCGPDGCYRDVSSVHGTYKKVSQTEGVLLLAGTTLKQLGVQKAVWVFDAPVSNSGRLRALCYKISEANGFGWEILLDNSPDKYLVQEGRAVCSADAWVLNHCSQWFNLGAYIVEKLYGEDVPEHVLRFEV